jgi:hypothetical protein
MWAITLGDMMIISSMGIPLMTARGAAVGVIVVVGDGVTVAEASGWGVGGTAVTVGSGVGEAGIMVGGTAVAVAGKSVARTRVTAVAVTVGKGEAAGAWQAGKRRRKMVRGQIHFIPKTPDKSMSVHHLSSQLATKSLSDRAPMLPHFPESKSYATYSVVSGVSNQWSVTSNRYWLTDY